MLDSVLGFSKGKERQQSMSRREMDPIGAQEKQQLDYLSMMRDPYADLFAPSHVREMFVKDYVGQNAFRNQLMRLSPLSKYSANTVDIAGLYGGMQFSDPYRGMSANVLPSQSDIGFAQKTAASMMAPARAELNNRFRQEMMQASRAGSQMGRHTSADPVIQAQLRRSRFEQNAALAGQQAAMGSNLAMQLPQQRFQQQMALAGGRASLADMQNKYMPGMVGQMLNQQQNQLSAFQVNQATRQLELSQLGMGYQTYKDQLDRLLNMYGSQRTMSNEEAKLDAARRQYVAGHHYKFRYDTARQFGHGKTEASQVGASIGTGGKES